MAVTQGELKLTVVEAEYDELCVDGGEPNTYFALILLESLKWRRRKSKRQSGLNPHFDETFVFEHVSSDSKVRGLHAYTRTCPPACYHIHHLIKGLPRGDTDLAKPMHVLASSSHAVCPRSISIMTAG